jgi:hypothetical protein
MRAENGRIENDNRRGIDERLISGKKQSLILLIYRKETKRMKRIIER